MQHPIKHEYMVVKVFLLQCSVIMLVDYGLRDES